MDGLASTSFGHYSCLRQEESWPSHLSKNSKKAPPEKATWCKGHVDWYW